MGALFKSNFDGEPRESRCEPLTCGEDADASPTVEAVLETECVALLALQASRARMRFLSRDHGTAEADLGGAIELVLHAMGELRARVAGGPPSLLALGFVVGDEDRPPV
ncbi:MAG TPA: hypothetical protein VG294_11030 [Solirubrobacteraceae bacterium]|nr:hypothetical protein [Solirubrobacteraceae bacterium]